MLRQLCLRGSQGPPLGPRQWPHPFHPQTPEMYLHKAELPREVVPTWPAASMRKPGRWWSTARSSFGLKLSVGSGREGWKSGAGGA